MTEADWMSCNDPTRMLRFLQQNRQGTPRQFRLFALTCFRGWWQFCPQAIEISCSSTISWLRSELITNSLVVDLGDFQAENSTGCLLCVFFSMCFHFFLASKSPLLLFSGDTSPGNRLPLSRSS